MKIRNFGIVTAILTIQTLSLNVLAQGVFQNLDFESASVPRDTPAGASIPIADGLPHWQVEFAGTPQSTMLYNSTTLGTSSIAIRTSPLSLVIDGNVTVWLKAIASGGTDGDVSLSQVGQIPADARSLEFKAVLGGFPGQFTVSINGNSLIPIPISVLSDYTLYGVDVSAFAGQSGNLDFTAISKIPTSPSSLGLDSISFSSQAIPEPSVLSLIAGGLGFLGFCSWQKSIRRP